MIHKRLSEISSKKSGWRESESSGSSLKAGIGCAMSATVNGWIPRRPWLLGEDPTSVAETGTDPSPPGTYLCRSNRLLILCFER